MKKRSRILFFLLGFTPFLLFLNFMATIHILAATSGFEGYRGGPQDAFRHTLASAYVARYLGPQAVNAFTELTERNASSSYDQMDWHNNALGMAIGISAEPDLYAAVFARIRNGMENARDPGTATWLPRRKWASLGQLLGLVN